MFLGVPLSDSARPALAVRRAELSVGGERSIMQSEQLQKSVRFFPQFHVLALYC